MILPYADMKPVVLNFNESLLRASREILRRNRNHAILVDDSSKPWGVLSIRDIAKAIFIEGEEGIELIELGYLGKILESSAKLYASRPIVSVSPSTSLKESVNLMMERNIGFLPILDEEGKIIGAIEERNLIRAVSDFSQGNICGKATWKLITIEAEEEILAAVGVMLTSGIRHLVVVENGSIYGIVSLLKVLYHITSETSMRELLKGSRSPIEEKVKLIAENPWTLDCSYSMREVASILAAERMGAVFVRDNDGNVGLFTDRDMLRILNEELNKQEITRI
ncbi:MAG: CBS domain-containing protein [Fervidicoccaceae archaeon]